MILIKRYKLYIWIVKVIIAGSNDIVRVGLRNSLSSDKFTQIIGEASNNDDLEEQIKNFETDIVIIDYTSAGFSIDVIPKILAKNKNIKFIAITPEQNASVVVDALRSGVMSYIKKDCDIPEILSSVQETGAGNKFFCGQILESIQRAELNVEDLDFDSFTC